VPGVAEVIFSPKLTQATATGVTFLNRRKYQPANFWQMYPDLDSLSAKYTVVLVSTIIAMFVFLLFYFLLQASAKSNRKCLPCTQVGPVE